MFLAFSEINQFLKINTCEFIIQICNVDGNKTLFTNSKTEEQSNWFNEEQRTSREYQTGGSQWPKSGTMKCWAVWRRSRIKVRGWMQPEAEILLRNLPCLFLVPEDMESYYLIFLGPTSLLIYREANLQQEIPLNPFPSCWHLPTCFFFHFFLKHFSGPNKAYETFQDMTVVFSLLLSP